MIRFYTVMSSPVTNLFFNQTSHWLYKNLKILQFLWNANKFSAICFYKLFFEIGTVGLNKTIGAKKKRKSLYKNRFFLFFLNIV